MKSAKEEFSTTLLVSKNCDEYFTLNDVEILNLVQLIAEKGVSKTKGLVLGRFVSAIGNGLLVELGKETFDITDYSSW